MSYTEEDFGPAPTTMMRYRCSCEKQGPLAVCQIKYLDEQGHLHRVCYRQQCQECGFVYKNRIGRNMYFTIKNGPEKFNYLPEFFWAPEEVTFDENMQYSKEKKLDFIRRILTLANKDHNKRGHLEYTKEQIYALDLTNK